MAARAGAVIADAEFVQFHPTALDVGRDPAPLATEALRGEGAVLVDRTGRRFMPDLHPEAELAPRDTVARGVFAAIMAGRGAFLDATEAIGGAFAARFPTVHAACLAAGFDPAVNHIPVAPAAHYHMGGIATDGRGRTSLPGLWAIGEVASTGIHGANRLASNSLLEAVVFAARAAADLRAIPLPVVMEQETAANISCSTSPNWRPDSEALRRLMTGKVGVLRDADGLASACADILRLEADAPHPAMRNRATSALLVAAAAFARRESRGGHARTDWPASDPTKARRSRLTLPQARGIAMSAISGAGLAGRVLS
jgi:L-aspartate oxidase